jgi:exodeoxyribonuclease (lambda-induced)
LVGDEGLVEIKCPYTVENHLAVLEGDLIADKDYQWQCQGGLWVTGRKWLDYVSFHPLMPEPLRMHVVRVNRDEDMIEDLEAAVSRFIGQMNIRLSKIRKAVDLV